MTWPFEACLLKHGSLAYLLKNAGSETHGLAVLLFHHAHMQVIKETVFVVLQPAIVLKIQSEADEMGEDPFA